MCQSLMLPEQPNWVSQILHKLDEGEPCSFGLCAFECFVVPKGHVDGKLYCGGGAGCCSKERWVIMQQVCRWQWTHTDPYRRHRPCFMILSQMEGFLLWLFIQLNVSVAVMTAAYLLRAEDHKCESVNFMMCNLNIQIQLKQKLNLKLF